MNRDFVEMLSTLSAAGVKFLIVGAHEAWRRRIEVPIGDLRVGVISRSDFITNKKAAGRPKDLLDLELLPPEE